MVRNYMAQKAVASVFIFGLLASCATIERGSSTLFLVQTSPAGATVTTDKVRRDKRQPGRYYGCAPTPCFIPLSRRSDFNVMITKEGHQPFTYPVFKDRVDFVAEKSEKGAMAVGAAAGVYTTASYMSIIASSGGAAAALSGPAIAVTGGLGLVVAVPAAATAGSIDAASGALIDLYPNPMNVVLAEETDQNDTQGLIDAFERSRDKKNRGR